MTTEIIKEGRNLQQKNYILIELLSSSKDKWLLWRFITAKVLQRQDRVHIFSLTYNPPIVSLSSARLLNAER